MRHLAYPNVASDGRGGYTFLGCGRYSTAPPEQPPAQKYERAQPQTPNHTPIWEVAVHLAPELVLRGQEVYEVKDTDDPYRGESLDLAYCLALIHCVRSCVFETLESIGDVWCTGKITPIAGQPALAAVDLKQFRAKLDAFIARYPQDKVFLVPAANAAHARDELSRAKPHVEVLSLQQFRDVLPTVLAAGQWQGRKKVVPVRSTDLPQLVEILFAPPQAPLERGQTRMDEEASLPGHEAQQWSSDGAFQPFAIAPSSPCTQSPLVELIGREEDIRTVRQLLKTKRLVTLLGSGGIGKTTLAMQLVSELSAVDHNLAYVSLENTDAQLLLNDPEYLVGVLANTVGVQAKHKTRHTLVQHLNRGPFLLVLDNCEHLVEQSAELIQTLLQACSGLRVLATSRRPLGILGLEQLWPVPALSIPPLTRLPTASEHLVSSLRQYASIRLFEQKAQQVFPQFEVTSKNGWDVARICHSLEGIPLAIELAASKVGVLPEARIAQGLEDCLSLLEYPDSTRPERSRTVRATIEWSYNLLRTDKERRLLGRLSVFRGWTWEAMQTVCAGQGLEAAEMQGLLSGLIRDSLVIFDTRGEAPRYRQLETIRQFSQEQLVQSGEAEALRQRHLAYYRALAERAEPQLMLAGKEGVLRELEQEHDNLKRALDFAVEAEHSHEEALRLTGALSRFWSQRGYLSEGRAYFKAVLSQDALADRPTRRAPGQGRTGRRTVLSNVVSFLLQRPSRDNRVDSSVLLAKALYGAGLLAWHQADAREARDAFERSLTIFQAAKEDTRRHVADVLNYLGNIANDSGDYTTARQYHEQSLEIRKQLPDRAAIAASLHNLGEVAFCEGKWDIAQSFLEQACGYLDDDHTNQAWTANCYELLGTIVLQQGDNRTAVINHEKALRLRDMRQDRVFIPYSLEGYAAMASVARQAERAARLLGAAASLRATFGVPLPLSWQKYYNASVESVRIQLSEQTFEAEWATGHDWTYEQMVQYALDDQLPCVPSP